MQLDVFFLLRQGLQYIDGSLYGCTSGVYRPPKIICKNTYKRLLLFPCGKDDIFHREG